MCSSVNDPAGRISTTAREGHDIKKLSTLCTDDSDDSAIDLDEIESAEEGAVLGREAGSADLVGQGARPTGQGLSSCGEVQSVVFSRVLDSSARACSGVKNHRSSYGSLSQNSKFCETSSQQSINGLDN